MSEAPSKTIMQKLIDRSQVYAQGHTPAMTLEDGKALPQGSVPKVTVIEYSIVRNAGGRASEALRSIICMDTLIGLEAVIVVHHTDCGLTHLTNASIRASLLSKNPSLASTSGAQISNMEFGEITEVPSAVREDVALLRESPLIGDEIPVFGCVYDIGTGLVEEII
ncbi:hypothetical protein BKA64DRAFT_700436 [Cadophora sp. MPI-SDFR-AT-0126]|nr:hypothetical protein BKA64DRAFT_700436 [Leotiomycetes sp. MPI-SDFR-AT-0126]